MAGFFVLLFLLSLVLLPIGLIKPSLFQKLFINTRKRVLAVFSGLAVLFFVLTGITAPQGTAKSITITDVKAVSAQISPSVPIQNPTIEKVSLAPTLTPTPIPTKVPTSTPTIKMYPTATPVPTIAQYTAPSNSQSGLSNNDYYTNTAGNEVHSPAYSNSAPAGAPAGASAICGDGTYSFSQSRSGTCSRHGGVAQWL